MEWETARDVYNNLEYFRQCFPRTQLAQKPKGQIYVGLLALDLTTQIA
jgi:hypothetical protein